MYVLTEGLLASTDSFSYGKKRKERKQVNVSRVRFQNVMRIKKVLLIIHAIQYK